jgi:FkbM family methyltransferase
VIDKIIVLDIGGGGGIHRSWDDFPCGLKYYSFDPNPEQTKDLIEQNSDITNKSKNEYVIINKGVTGKTEVRRVNIFDNRFAGTLYQHTVGGCYRFAKMKLISQIEVECISIGDLCKDENIHPDFLSIDAEGSTYDVLHGGIEQLKENVLGVRVELELSHLYEHSPKFYESIKLLDEIGYKFIRIETCNAGFFGATTDMNKYSVSSSDAMPLTTDVIFINTPLIRSLIDHEITEYSLYRIVSSIIFCIHNSCGFYGMDLLLYLKKRYDLSRLSVEYEDLMNLLFSEMAMYFTIERRNINKDFDAAGEFYQLTGKQLEEQSSRSSESLGKLKHIYDEDGLYENWVKPSGQSDTVKFN